ncbi:MAG: hypothetical protein A2075_02715 [Geobacteraceae bacterium GWC2_58_44]|nr:MAG: hypothetical protein A2075_02715 [Geobacteraceae bacterium GWC2_58_44]HBG05171.1 hypothetical protein [Geobacter sp.]
MGKTLYSGFRFSHHNQGSGYDNIVADRRHYVCGNSLPFGSCPEPSPLRKINFLLVDLYTLCRGLGYPVIHYFYPENTAYLSPLILGVLGKKIVFTVHLAEEAWLAPGRTPFGWLKRQGLKRADLIITLSSDQARKLKELFPHKEVRFVPHGMELGHPPPDDGVLARRRAELKIAVVGSNYRDFEMLERIVALRSSRPVTFHLVGLNQHDRRRFAGMAGVLCHNRLDSAQYEALLQSSFLMALPLSYATANNALLEAHKYHLPSVCSDIPGISDYALGDTMLFRSAGDFWHAFDRLARLTPEGYRDLCLRTNREAQARFTWEEIRREIAALASFD